MGRSFLSIKLAVIFGLLVGSTIMVLTERIERRTPAVQEVMRTPSPTALTGA